MSREREWEANKREIIAGGVGWNLATRKRSTGRNFSLAGTSNLMSGRKTFTVSMDNLSEDMDAEWLGQIFSKYGHVLDVFISKKKSKGFKSNFGFVRFASISEAKAAINDLNGICIREKNMLVKLASFDLHPLPISRQGNDKSYAEAVVGKHQVAPKCSSTKAIATEWLSRSVVAKLKSLTSMESIREALHCEGGKSYEVRVVGEQVVLQGHCSVCNLKIIESGKEEEVPCMVKDNSANNSMDEMASRHNGLRKVSNLGRRLKSWEEILGVKEIDNNSLNGGRRRKKTKQVVFRSAAAAVSLTLLFEGIRNRNRILLDEAQAIWTMGRIVGGEAVGFENEVISKLDEIEEDKQGNRKEGGARVQP
ncbi:hypothetical protein Vadar_031329 [Vaccinium darrowii]|uniref:Uncharacterized protein n=1 Tax=Vaccinium darrowii TaxID=229202 RepID=A0ACB7XDG2_9ERIC|nr:hypothetical protein Vadar_031329 [Vaccinium darrowii]